MKLLIRSENVDIGFFFCYKSFPTFLIFSDGDEVEYKILTFFSVIENIPSASRCWQNTGNNFLGETGPSVLPDSIAVDLPTEVDTFYASDSRLAVLRCHENMCSPCGTSYLVQDYAGKTAIWSCSDAAEGHIFNIEAHYATSVLFCNLRVGGIVRSG